jgi:hypothetical protein
MTTPRLGSPAPSVSRLPKAITDKISALENKSAALEVAVRDISEAAKKAHQEAMSAEAHAGEYQDQIEDLMERVGRLEDRQPVNVQEEKSTDADDEEGLTGQGGKKKKNNLFNVSRTLVDHTYTYSHCLDCRADDVPKGHGPLQERPGLATSSGWSVLGARSEGSNRYSPSPELWARPRSKRCMARGVCGGVP